MKPGSVPGQLRATRLWLAALLMALALIGPAHGQNLPRLTGRVVDQADLLPPDREAALNARLEALERSTSRQLVVVTIPHLQGYTIEDFGFRLGEAWRLGDVEGDNGAILLIALADKKIRIEVGDGLEPILTDAMSGLIIRETMRPRFQAGDFAGGIDAGVEAIIGQLQAPPEVAERRAVEAANRQHSRSREDSGASAFPLMFWIIILFFVVIPLLRGGFGGRKYRGRRRGFGGPIVIWGPGWGGGGGSSRGWGGWGGGGGGFGGGGFSGGGGSFGGGGASGGW